MKKILSPEKALIFSTAFLILLGITIVASVSTISSQEKFGITHYYLARQLQYIIIGLIIGFFAFKIPLNFYKKWSLAFLVGTILLMIAVFIPGVGFSSGGASRWISVGPIFFQPGEFLKLAFIIFLAGWLGKISSRNLKNRKKKKDFYIGLGICLAFFAIASAILIKQPDASTLVIIFFTSTVVYFLSGTPIWHTITLSLIGITGIAAMIKFAAYRFNRLSVFLDSSLDPMGLGYQMKQVYITIGSGGIFGLGLGMSRQKFGFLPEPMGDTVFAVFAEETGLLGGALMIALFALFAWSGFAISKKTGEKSFSLLAAGITTWISFQAFINIAAMLRVIPLVGVPLPFVSYGGSHLIIELAAVGILLNIAKNKS